MPDGLIYLTPMAASYFRIYGFGLVDASTIQTKPYNEFDWGMVLLNKSIHTFQPFDSMSLEVKLADAKLTEHVRQEVGKPHPTSRIMLDLAMLPETAIHGLHGKRFADLVDGAPAWLAEGLALFEVDVITTMGGRLQLCSQYVDITEATSLKVRVNLPTNQNFNRVSLLAEAAELNPADAAEMHYG